MDVKDFLDAPPFGFDHILTFTRQRAQLIVDPYDPDAPGVPDWSNPDEIEIRGYFASQASSEQADPVRGQVVTTKQLVLDDPEVDVQRGDRIRLGTNVWTVIGFPSADVNPFTGWQPTRVCNLEEAVG